MLRFYNVRAARDLLMNIGAAGRKRGSGLSPSWLVSGIFLCFFSWIFYQAWIAWTMPFDTGMAWQAVLTALLLLVFFLVNILVELRQKLKREKIKSRMGEARFEKLYGANVIGLLFTGFDGRIVRANSAFLDIVGYTSEDLENGLISWKDLTPPEYQDVSRNALEQLREKGHCDTFEKEYFHKDGHRVRVYLGSSLLEPGDFAEIVTYVLDVSGIQKAEGRFRFITDAVPHKMWTADKTGKATYYNKGWFEYTATNTLDELRKEIWDTIHPDDRERVTTLWKTALERGEDMEVEQRFRRFDGVYLWHLTRACLYKDENGGPDLWVGSSTNIHEQKMAEEAIRASEAHFRALTNTDSLLIWQVDADCRMTYVNDTWRNYTGIGTLDITEDDWLGCIHPDDRKAAADEFAEAFTARVPCRSKYRFRQAGSGDYRWMLDRAQPVLNPEFSGYIGTMTDIHEQETSGIALRVLMEKKDEFFGIASHELKTPITTMRASLQMLERRFRKDAVTPDALPLVERAGKQVNKLTGIVNDLLDVSRIQAGKLLLNKSEYDFGDSLADCLQGILLEEPEVEVKIIHNPKITIVADRNRVEQVILNLVSNAIKYSPGKGTVTITSEIDNGYLKCSVSDHGIGIPEGKQPFVFDRFFRVHDSSQMYPGLGLGLYISSEIIKKHGGMIGLRSQEGEGSEFWFMLPVSTQTVID